MAASAVFQQVTTMWLDSLTGLRWAQEHYSQSQLWDCGESFARDIITLPYLHGEFSPNNRLLSAEDILMLAQCTSSPM